MNRRQLLRLIAGSMAAASYRSGIADSHQNFSRAAVVIGINKSGDLPKLDAAAPGAIRVAEWLRQEGFQVREFVDEKTIQNSSVYSPVRAADIFDAVNGLVQLGTLEQLIVYFSGHGFNVRYSEHWLLSGAPQNPNETISLIENIQLARQAGIPNVVFISDACRSTSDSLNIQQIHGSLIFPGGPPGRVFVDKFYATLVGDVALEINVDESIRNFKGIYTEAFLEAFNRPYAEMIKKINGTEVVPNRALRKYLEREVQNKASAKSITLRQTPDSQIESDDDFYIARYRPAESGDPVPTLPSAPPLPSTDNRFPGDIRIVANAGLESASVKFPSQTNSSISLSAADSRNISELSGYGDAVRNINLAFSGRRLVDRNLRNGVLLYGTDIARVTAIPASLSPRQTGEILPASEHSVPRVIETGTQQGTIIIRFGSGSGTIVANLPGFICTVVVENDLVVSVSYLPDFYEEYDEHLKSLHSSVAAAARFGVFRIEGTGEERVENARNLASKIRMDKGRDPTLGIYAAYAYADGGLYEDVRSVSRLMEDRLFDVEMLAGNLVGIDPLDTNLIVPLCPMLSQGWDLLRVNNVSMPRFLRDARAHVKSSLWTTFDSEGMDIVLEGLRL